METLLKADMFFAITSVAVILIALAAILALIYVILILNELRRLMREIRQEGESLISDISRVRQAIEKQGWRTKEAIDSLGAGAWSLLKFFFRTRTGGRDRDQE